MQIRLITSAAMSVLLAYPAELPIKQIALYKHGVGFFERQGTVSVGDSARLDFKADQMNDVLKSLSITEKDGGKVSGVRYDSSIPLEEKLAEFPFKIENGQALSAILDQLRGSRVEIQFGTEKTVGIVVGARVLQAGPPPAVAAGREQITLLLDNGDLRTFDLAAASGIRFTDVKLQGQFRDYLTAVAASRSTDTRSVFIDSVGGGARDVTASYIVPSPVWKSSYRLLLGDKGASTLEGWAIVDNTTGEDWTGVRMALISGKPISFISELYEPKYIERLTADLPEQQAEKPVVYQSAMRKAAPPKMAMAGGLAMNRAMPVPAPIVTDSVMIQEPSTIAKQALAQERGDLFEYDIATPVTIRKNESAMLPFLQDKLDARRLLIFSEDSTSTHPLQAAELKNGTGKTLDGGPITVFDAGAYAGEALVATVKAGDKRLISYAVDLGTTVTTAFDSTRNLTREVHLSHGVLTSKIAGTEVKTFTASNVDAKAKTLIIEHPKRDQYQLLSPKTPFETTPNGYRFELAVPAAGSAKLAVSEERVFDTTVQISNLANQQITELLQNKSLSEAGRRALNSIIAQKAKIAGLDRQIAAATGRMDSLNNDARRVRDNIGTLNGVSGQQTQVQTYATKLASIEAEISAASDSRKLLQSQRAEAQTALDSSILNLEF